MSTVSDRSTTTPAPATTPVAEGHRGRLGARLVAPVDGASMAVFRVMFGAVMLWEVFRYFSYGWIEAYWIAPAFNFAWPGLAWLTPLPGRGMVWLFVVLGVLAILIALGAWYRIAAAAFTVAFTYMFVLEQARYLNHFYLICLLGLLLTVVPAHRLWSVDALARPALRADTVPAWSLWLLRLQIGVMYAYAGIAKVGTDWLAGQPMGLWMREHADVGVIGPLLQRESVAVALSWGGLAFDLSIVPLLLWRRTRVLALLLAAGFHLANARLFSIGVFPVLAMAATLLFCEPDWPRRLLRRPPAAVPATATRAPASGWRRAGAGLLVAYVALQLTYPLRHFLVPGPANWTEEGHRFAWHMKLRTKSADATFTVVDPRSGTSLPVDLDDHLTSWQATAMASRPDMIASFARYLAAWCEGNGIEGAQVYASVRATLNDREPQPLVDPTVDLARVPAFEWHREWIVPLAD